MQLLLQSLKHRSQLKCRRWTRATAFCSVTNFIICSNTLQLELLRRFRACECVPYTALLYVKTF